MAVENQSTIEKGISRRRLLRLAGLSTLAVACEQAKPAVASATATKTPEPTATPAATKTPPGDVRQPTPTQPQGGTGTETARAATGPSTMGSGVTGFEKTRPPWVELERKYAKDAKTNDLEGRKEAARRHGRDSYSKDPDKWEINKEGGAMLKPVSEGVPFVSLVSTDDTVLESWLEVPQRPENTNFNAVVFIVPPDVEIPVRGGTFWPFGRSNIRGAMAQVKWDVTQKELVGRNGVGPEQPGVKILEICPPGAPAPIVPK